MRHCLKTDSNVFHLVVREKKTFEIRLDDRGFAVGDTLTLKETEYTGEQMKNGLPFIYTGHVFDVTVTHIMRGPVYGLIDGWVIMSIQPILSNKNPNS